MPTGSRGRRSGARLASAMAAVGLAALAGAASANHPLGHYEVRLRPGVYYPGPYYSRSYIQDHELRPGERILFYRLRPWEHYSEARLGKPGWGLVNGSIDSDRFAYRYRYDFVPVQIPPPISVEDCPPPPKGLRVLPRN